MNIRLAILALCFAALGCSQSLVPKTAPSESGPEPVRPVEDRTLLEVEPHRFSKDLLTADTPFKGAFINGLAWSDTRGLNVVVFSRSDSLDKGQTQFGFAAQGISVVLYARHYLTNEAKTVLLRAVEAKELRCDGDMATRFHPASFEVTDLDDDGVGEASFGYTSASCRTDMSPAQFDLVLLEGGEQYGLTGMTYWTDAKELPQEARFTSSAGIQPPAFEKHLQKRWPGLSNESAGPTPSAD